MAAEVVGTAFVRIRALTTGLAKEIERGVNKGANDAKLTAGTDLGKKVVDDFGREVEPGINKTTKKVIDDFGNEVGDKGGANLSDHFLKAFQGNINAGNFKGAADLLSRKISTDFKAGFEKELAKALDSGDFEKAGSLLQRRIKLDEKGGEDAGNRFLTGLRRVFRRDGGGVGGEAGGFFGGGFGEGALLKIGVLAAPALQGAVSALLQYVVALVGQVGFLTTGLIGLGAAGSAAFGAVGLSALPLLLAFKATTPALEKFQKRLSEVGHQWTEVGAATQQTLLSGLTYALNLSTKLIPDFRAFGRQVGTVVSFFVKWQADLLTSANALVRLRGIMFGSIEILRNLLSAAGDLIDIFLNLWASSILPAIDLSATLSHITDRLQEITAAARESGQLSRTIREWYERGKLVIGALADIAVGIFNILKIGANNAGSFFDTFRKFAADFRAFTSSEAGQNKLARIFEQANAIAHEFNGLIGDIFKAIGGAVFDAGGADGIIGFIQVLRTDVVPFLTEFLTQVSSSYGPQLLEFFRNFGKLLTELSKSGALGTTLATINITLRIFNDILSTLLKIPGFQKFLGYLFAFSSIMLIPGLGAAIRFIAGGILELTGALLGLEEGAGAITVITTLAETLGGVFGVAGIAGIATGGAIIIGVVAAIAGAAYLIIRNWSTIKKFFLGIFHFLQTNFKTIAEVVGALIIGGPLGVGALVIIKNWSKIKDFFGKVFPIIGRFFERLGSDAGKLAEKLGGALLGLGGKLIEAVAKGFADLVTALPGLAVNVLTFFAALPFTIIGQMVSFAALLISLFLDGVLKLVQALPGMWDAVFNFFKSIPGFIGNVLSNIGSFLAGIFTSAWDAVSSAVSTGWNAVASFFASLPARIGGFLESLPGRIANAFITTFNTVRNVVSTGISDVADFFTRLPGRITGALGSIGNAGERVGSSIINGIGKGLSAVAGFLGDLKDAVGRALKTVINSFIDKLNDAIPDKLGTGAFSINLPNNPIPRLATGAIVSRRPGGILANIGEGRYDEGVLPLPPGVIEGLQAIARGAGAGGRPIEVTVNEAHTDPRATAFTVATRLGDLVDR